MGPSDTDSADDSAADEALMLAYGRGNVPAFERLYARHKGPTYRYFLRHTGDGSSAAELQQDLWLRVVRARERYVADARFTTWLYTLARHRLVDHWRSQRGSVVASFDEAGPTCDDPEDGDCGAPSGEDDPLANVMDAEAGARLVSALREVPAAQRDAFLLHVDAGLSLGEIASLAGVPAETIKSRLRYAYRRLRAALEDLQ
jgi:RNA polymerase sigma-70 factor (ECF subfamily)